MMAAIVEHVQAMQTSHLLNVWFAFMAIPRVQIRVDLPGFVVNNNEHRALLYKAICEEIDTRIPASR